MKGVTQGFTLIELIISLAVLSIICMISIAPMTKMLEHNKVSADVMTFISTINTARNKAISSKHYIKICGEDSMKECTKNWRTLTVRQKDNKELLHQEQLNANFQSVKWSAFQNKAGLTIAPNGYTAHQNGTLYLCHNQYPSLHRAIVVSKSGRTTVLTQSDSIDEKCSTK